MLIYVASYPRSGSKLIRMILKQCFELNCYNARQPKVRPTNVNAALGEATGAVWWHHDTLDAFLDEARRSPDLFLLRTHTKEVGDRAIYVIRDGRAALASYQRFLLRFANREHSLAELIEGKVWPGRWDQHVDFWLDRPDTLVLRFEDLATNPPLEKIGAFLDSPVLRKFSVTFADAQKLDPNHMEFGHNTPGIERVEQECSELFWRINGDTMRRAYPES